MSSLKYEVKLKRNPGKTLGWAKAHELYILQHEFQILQRINYAKRKSDAVAKLDGSYVSKEKKGVKPPQDKRKAPEQGWFISVNCVFNQVSESNAFYK